MTFLVVAACLAIFVAVAVVANPQDGGGTTSLLGPPQSSASPDTTRHTGPAGATAHPRPTAPSTGRTADPNRPPDPKLTGRPQFYVTGSAVALTFDDGPDPRWTPQILDVLRANHIRATFCMIGRQAAEYPDLVRRIAAEGHALCDHTWDHDERLPTATGAHVDQEIDDGYDAIVRASGGVRPRYFRSPGGAWSPVVLSRARELGMRPLAWSVDPQDWRRPGTARIESRVLTAGRGDVILCHDGGGTRTQTIAAIRQVVPTLRQRGLAFVLP